MGEARVRVVVGEGESPRKGLLRFVLEGDGYDVVAEASTPAELARVLADHRPDVVVIDDSIGATAPQVAREVFPGSKVVLVWPKAVVPIGGDARVEPSQVLRQLGPTVATVTAGIAGIASIERPGWVEKVRKDPATLREMLERRGGLPTTRPSVTELQRRGQRLHPTPSTPGPETEDDDAVAPVVPIAGAVTAADAAAVVGEATIELPETPDAGAPVLHLPADEVPEAEDASAVAGALVVPIGAAVGTRGAGAAGVADAEATELNRRLGTIALGGAAVIGAVVFALALGGSRVPTDIIVAEGPRATIAPGPPIDSGLDPSPTPEPGVEPPTGPGGPEVDPGLTPTSPPTYPPSPADGNPSVGGTESPPSVPGGGTEPPPSVPGGGTEPPPSIPGDGGTPPPNTPGKSAAHNPHGTPPGHASGSTPGPGGGASGGGASGGSGPSGNGARHWDDGLPGQAGQHGQGIEHGKGLDKLSHRHKT